MTRASAITGQKGESIAQFHYRRQGFQIVALNWRAGRLGEIDLIAYHPPQRLLVFVEVKARRSAEQGHPLEAVGVRKQRQLRLLAEAYLAGHPQAPDVNMRFDVVGIYYPGNGLPAEVSSVENAF